MRIADDRARWREIGQAYVQQWTVVADDDDDDKTQSSAKESL
jgi:hypothetical protein